MTAGEKAGLSTPELMVKLDNWLSVLADLVTVTEYVSVLEFCAVTTTVIVLEPTFRLIVPDAEPEATAAPFTVTVDVVSETVGVTVA